jgi:hypothetical protein
VLHLDILPDRWDSSYRFSDWENLSDYASTTTLLPNLQKLIFACKTPKDEEFIQWIIPFLSPTLLEIHTHPPNTPYQARLSEPRAGVLLRAISERCPSLSVLSFFPVEFCYPPSGSYEFDDYNIEDSEDSEISEDDECGGTAKHGNGANALAAADDIGTASTRTKSEPFFEYLKRIESLRTLDTTVIMLYPQPLRVLANLPNLEKLALHYQLADEPDCFGDSTLSEHSFPSLRSLSISFPDILTICFVWEILPLVGRLTSFTIDMAPSAGADLDFDLISNFMRFIPTICTRSPHLQEITIDVDASYAVTRVSVTSDELRHFVALPLRKLDLRNFKLVNIPQACLCLASCSTLRDLRLQHQSITYKDMAYFARITSLESLHVLVKWDNFKSMIECKDIIRKFPSFSNLRVLQCSNTVQLDQKVLPLIVGYVTRDFFLRFMSLMCFS